VKGKLTILAKAIKKAERKRGKGWLHLAIGRRLLKMARSLNLPWPRMTRLFSRSQGCLEKLFSFHRIRKARPEFLTWTKRTLVIVRKFYQKSVGIQTVHDSTRLSLEMYRTVNKERRRQGLNQTSLNGIRCFAQAHGLRWGWHTRIPKRPFSAKEKAILLRHFMAASWPSLVELLPGRSRDQIYACACQMGLRRKRSAYSSAELALIHRAVEDSKKIDNDERFNKIIVELESRLKRSAHGIGHKMRQLGIQWHYRPKGPVSPVRSDRAAMWKP